MKKSLFVLFTILFISTTAWAKLNVVVSIQPELEFVQKIGGEKIKTTLMVPAGKSPHTYEPKATQMKAITHADLYLAIGVEFEKVWLEKFKNQNQHLIIQDLSKDINKSAMLPTHEHHDERTQGLDPHIWVDPVRVRQIAKNIYQALSQEDPANQAYYLAHLNSYLNELNDLDQEIRSILKEVPKGSVFMVFHPAWGYFAQRYNLKQLPIEIEGKSPKPRQLIQIIKEAKKAQVKAIFTQPEFSDQMAQTIAKELKIEVIKTSPLAKAWAKNLLKLARAIAKGAH